MDHLNPVLSGATAFASFLASIFFFKFLRKTGDLLFLFFAAAFAIDAVARAVLAVVQVTNASEPMFSVPRLITYSLIALSIAGKNAIPTKRM